MEISELEEFKKELGIATTTLSSLIGLIDNYILAKKEIIERNNEIRDLKCELAKMSSEQMNFNNFSLLKQQDKQVNELQQEIQILKKQLAKYTCSTHGSSSPKLSISILPNTETTEVSKHPALEQNSAVKKEQPDENVVVPEEPKKRGRKNVQKPKIESKSLEETMDIKPIETEIETKIINKKYSRKKKNDPVVIIPVEQELLETKSTLLTKLENEKITQGAIPNVIPNVIPTEIISPKSIEENIPDSSINEPEAQIPANEDDKLEKNTKIVGHLTLSYDEPISINEQIPEPPDDTTDLDIITIGKTKYWIYNNLLYEFININKVGNFIRKYN